MISPIGESYAKLIQKRDAFKKDLKKRLREDEKSAEVYKNFEKVLQPKGKSKTVNAESEEKAFNLLEKADSKLFRILDTLTLLEGAIETADLLHKQEKDYLEEIKKIKSRIQHEEKKLKKSGQKKEELHHLQDSLSKLRGKLARREQVVRELINNSAGMLKDLIEGALKIAD